MKTEAVSYWTATILLAASILTGGIAQLFHQPQITAVITKLGYPLYFVTILGFWKIVGAVAAPSAKPHTWNTLVG